jgi:hypothetical protein
LLLHLVSDPMCLVMLFCGCMVLGFVLHTLRWQCAQPSTAILKRQKRLLALLAMPLAAMHPAAATTPTPKRFQVL